MKVTERVARLAIIVIVLIVVVVAGCERAMTVTETVMPDPTEEVTPPIDLFLDWPGEDTTDEERNRWWEAVWAAAVNVNLLDITGCTPDPLVIQVEFGESITIKNSDATDHTIHWGGGASIIIPAGGTVDIVVSSGNVFHSGVGAYVYSCDDGPAAGIFYAVESPPSE